jgi:hypothetical protein
MLKTIVSLPVLAVCLCALGQPAAASRDIYPDTWVARDALGRSMPTSARVGPVKTDHRRVVGIFYITWHVDAHKKLKAPYSGDVSRILANHPDARLDGKHPAWKESSYHWGEPEMDYFLSQDEYVIRKDMSMLADAGVDVLVMDVTNAVLYWDEWEVLFSTMLKMRAEGNKVPQFCFWAFNGPVINVVQQLYDRVYAAGKYRDLWFDWDGRPLLLYNGNPSVDANGKGGVNHNPNYIPEALTNTAHAHYGNPKYTNQFLTDYSKEVKDAFTLRTMWWGYHEWAGKRFVGAEDNWSFGLDLGNPKVAALTPEKLISTRRDGRREQAAVTPGQHPTTLIGKSWTRASGEPPLNEHDLPQPAFVPWLGRNAAHPEAYGIYFQERWDEALAGDPEFLYINDWNEWTAGKYAPQGGGKTPFMRRESDYFFVDQYNSEFNRCVQPMKGGYTDNYYMQMAQNIRRYKGARPIPAHRGYSHMRIDGDFSDWAPVQIEYRDTIGDTFHRNHPGYSGVIYTNNSGRNDIIASKVAFDRSTAYFYAETSRSITHHSGGNWMLLLLDADSNPNTGWYGYDYLINQALDDKDTTILMRHEGNRVERDPGTPPCAGPEEPAISPWRTVARLNYRYEGRGIEIAIPRKLLGLTGSRFTFDFHWVDNPDRLENPISLCTHGDSAPNRRFNYRCVWEK